MRTFYAHSKGNDQTDWEPLEEHLCLVAFFATRHVEKFEANQWGKVLGLWHDLGKYSQAFQDYLAKAGQADVHTAEIHGRVDHSTAGAKHAIENAGLEIPIARALAYCIAGHHAGLANAESSGDTTSLSNRLRKPIEAWDSAPQSFLDSPKLALPIRIQDGIKAVWQDENGKVTIGSRQRACFTWAFFVRMLFSSLVDADFLATEAFMSPESAAERPKYKNTFSDMIRCLDAEIASLSSSTTSPIHGARSEIVDACNAAASRQPGLFSLTVPTGGGKTLAGLSFALRHAIANPEHAFERIIVAIPFTSIIEQTARVYQRVFAPLGEEVVLEHHSNLEPKNETDRSRLISQNFDAPLVVTTNIQLFESMFANRTSKCRKLHNFARSIIILDEAQTLPIEFLEPTLLAIRELVNHYGCTVVLCTATQPVVLRTAEFKIGLENVTEIIPEPKKLYERMKRVRVGYAGTIDIENLVLKLVKHDQFLCIHNTRPDARETFRLLREGGDSNSLFHLSTFMCPTHRKRTLQKIRQRLVDGKKCKVVSTQLIEAGVDVDFPVVYRAIAGLDSIAQAAGRCNREGKQTTGDVHVFSLPNLPPKGFLRDTATTTQTLLAQFQEDLISPEAIEAYFRKHYWMNSLKWDKAKIMEMHTDLFTGSVEFESIANAYRIIQDNALPIVVPYGPTGRKLRKRLLSANPTTKPLSRVERKLLSRFSVSLFENVVTPLIGREFEYAYEGQYLVLLNDNLYDEALGIDLQKIGQLDAGELIV